jgi:hypothetical protein
MLFGRAVVRRAVGARDGRVLLRRLGLGEEGALFASFYASRACWELFVALRGKDEVLVRVVGKHVVERKQSKRAPSRVSVWRDVLHVMCCRGPGPGSWQKRDKCQDCIAVSRYRMTPGDWAVTNRRETHFDSSYFTLVASQAALCVAPAHRHDRQGGKGQGRTQASSRWLRATHMSGAYEVDTR